MAYNDFSGFREKMVNPVMKKTMKGETSSNVVSYSSVYTKSLLFLFTVLVGLALAIVVHNLPFDKIQGIEKLSLSMVEAILGGVAVISSIVFTLLASFITSMVAVFGTISCISYGYILGFAVSIIPEYAGPMILALAFTVAIVIVLAVLYRTKVIKVGQKFRAVAFTLLFTMLLGSLFMLIFYLIPFTRTAASWVLNNAGLSILFAVLGVVLASMFLIMDFDSIERAVANGLDKKYENALAFSLAFSVIWLYFKILDLILRIMSIVNRK